MRRIAMIPVTVFLVAACGSGVATSSPSPSSPANCGHDTCHFDDDILAFDYPASWHQATYNVVSSFSNDLVYLSTAPMSDPCDRAPSSVSCSRLAATSLGTNGVLVTWTARGWPGWTFDPNKGSPLSVGQREATFVTESPEEGCKAIGGVREIVVVVPRSAPDNWMQLDACLAGPSPSAGQSQVEAMLKTVRWSS